MARYYFHLRDGEHLYRDDEGQELSNIDMVREQTELHAKDVLAEMIHDRHMVTDQQVEATTDQGAIVTVVPIKIMMGLPWAEVETAKQSED